MRKLLLSPLFDELTKRSLLARIVKLYPELESMIAGSQPAEKIAPLIVSSATVLIACMTLQRRCSSIFLKSSAPNAWAN